MVVFPRGSAEADGLLRTRVGAMRVTGVPAVEVLRRLAGSVTERRLPPMVEPPLSAPAARESWNRPVTVVLAKTTVRDVLDAIVKAHGALSWSVQPDRSGNAMLGLIGDGWQQATGATPPR